MVKPGVFLLWGRSGAARVRLWQGWLKGSRGDKHSETFVQQGFIVLKLLKGGHTRDLVEYIKEFGEMR
ncbi:hypothetical protein H6G64_32440 [Calothrix sp. FACHB-156]|nr:hypothetical protein [Calothrix sp. FACHB-156]